MKIKITDLSDYESEDFLLINQNGEVVAVSGNTEFNDLGVKIPTGEYLVAQVLEEGKSLDVVGCQWHHGPTEVQEYVLAETA